MSAESHYLVAAESPESRESWLHKNRKLANLLVPRLADLSISQRKNQYVFIEREDGGPGVSQYGLYEKFKRIGIWRDRARCKSQVAATALAKPPQTLLISISLELLVTVSTDSGFIGKI